MSARKTERLFNLVICLLAAQQYVSKDRIRSTVVGYGDCATDDAFDRMFERDKDELREMGVPLEMGANSAYFEDELGYRIRPDVYALPEISLEPDEASVLGLAARVWQQASLSSAASAALLKLRAAGVLVGEVSLPAIEPRAAAEPAFEPLWRAVHERRPVSFGYRSARASEPAKRVVEPWGVVSSRGRWYLAGHDRGRGAVRVFRLDRIVGGQVRVLGRPNEVAVPPDADVGELVRASVSSSWPAADGVARLLLREGAGHPLRGQAVSVKPAEDRPGWDVVELPRGPRLGAWLPGFGADVLVLDPPDLRDEVIGRLRLAAGAETAATEAWNE